TRRAFDLSREPTRLRDAYGRNSYGQSCLLARRLVEAGTRMVLVRWAPDCNATWDTHGTIANQPPAFDVLKGALLPQLDAGPDTPDAAPLAPRRGAAAGRAHAPRRPPAAGRVALAGPVAPEVGHHDPPQRRPVPPRHVRHEAGRARRVPRRVPPDQDERCRR